MVTKLPYSAIQRSPTSSPKGGVPAARKPAHLRGFSPLRGGQHCPPHCPPQPAPVLRQPGHVSAPPLPLGPALDVRAVARLIGCSPWTVRQTLIPRGLPFFRSGASGRLIFYRDQVIRWIENQQGGTTTK